ncbi:MAG: hypothetical protein CML29_02080 [Rhizobiales bacterium]|nr:hypothetical protein [Hyphomicrobiales bacterium]MBA70074.1 hypothetical protein [Hyphomicrobiales bacterium]|tara:strand:- start:1062 stop:1667 length:606 start_codon:yes stop_codon:yes gene_type:complete
MRLIALLVALLGALLAFGYSAWIDLRSGVEIGRYALETRFAEPAGPTLTLSPADAPVGLYLSAVRSEQAIARGGGAAVFEVSVLHGGSEIERKQVRFEFGDSPGDGRTLSTAQALRMRLVLLLKPSEQGSYRVLVARGDDEGPELSSAVLSVRRKAIVPDDRVAPAGFLLLVIGGVAFVLFRRRKPARTDPRPPRSHKWGR